MRFALIDNSTLTAVQRLLGRIPIKNTLGIDMDILCLENLLEAILFYDKVVVIDDYKPQFRKYRERSFPNILSIEPDVILYDDVLYNARKFTENIIPRVEAGQFADGDFKPFFDLLKMNVVFTWDMASSVYYLTHKMLAGVGGVDLEKYSKLSSAIFFELYDKRRSQNTEEANDNDNVILVDSSGQRIPTKGHNIVDYKGIDVDVGGLAPQTEMFFAGLSWLALRTVFYTIAARNLGTDLFLHPIRHAFQINFLSKLHQENPSIFKPLIDTMNDMGRELVNKVLSSTQPFVTSYQIPLFVAWFAHHVGDPMRYLEVAYEIRYDSPFQEARARLIDLEEIIASDDDGKWVIEANKIIREVEKSLKSLESKYYVTTTQGVPLSNFITLWNLAALFSRLPSIPEIDVRISQLEFLKHLVPQKGFNGIYRSLVADLTQVSRLGKYYEIVASRVRLDEEATAYYEKTEELRYYKRRAGWKIPM